jgi:bilin biosynthesis protein
MLRTPLLLTLMALSYRGRVTEVKKFRSLKTTPGGIRDKLLADYVEKRYKVEEFRAGKSLPFGLDEIQRVLGQAAAIWLGTKHLGDTNVFSVPHIRTHLGDRTQEFLELTARLKLVAPASELFWRRVRYSFIHPVFRDHFVYTWCKGEMAEGRISNATIRALGAVADERAVPLLLAVLKSEDRGFRAAAVEALGRIRDPDALPTFVSALGDESHEVQVQAIGAIAAIGSDEAIDAIVKVIRGQGDDFVQMAAIGTLRMYLRGNPRAHEELVNAVVEGLFLPMAMIPAIGLIDERLHDPLLACLCDTDAQVRRLAAGGLALNPDVRALPHLMALLRGSDEDTWQTAANAIGAIADQVVEELLRSFLLPDQALKLRLAVALGRGEGSTVEALTSALNNEHKAIREGALMALVFQGPRAILRLIQLVANDKTLAGAHGIAALSLIGMPAVGPLIAAIERGDGPDEDTSVMILSKVDRVVSELGKAFVSCNSTAKLVLERTLERIVCNGGQHSLEAELRRADGEWSYAIARALGSKKDGESGTEGAHLQYDVAADAASFHSIRDEMNRSVAEYLTELLSNGPNECKPFAMISLLRLGQAAFDTIASTVMRVAGEQRHVLLFYLALLVQIQASWSHEIVRWFTGLDEKVQDEVGELISSVSHSDHEEFTQILEYSEEMQRQTRGWVAAYASLLGSCPGHFKDEHVDVRRAAVSVIGMVGSTTSVEHLVVAIGLPDEEVATRAVVALGKIGGVTAAKHLRRLENQGSPKLRRFIALALEEIGYKVDSE